MARRRSLLAIYGARAWASARCCTRRARSPTGATHNDCADFKRADRGGARHRRGRRAAERRSSGATQACLDEHELTTEHAFRTEYLFWSLWPAVICARVFLLWPRLGAHPAATRRTPTRRGGSATAGDGHVKQRRSEGRHARSRSAASGRRADHATLTLQQRKTAVINGTQQPKGARTTWTWDCPKSKNC